MAAGLSGCQGGLRQDGPPAYGENMSKADQDRNRRLGEALRSNLRRRKAQARGEGSAGPAEGEGGDADREAGPPQDPTSDRH